MKHLFLTSAPFLILLTGAAWAQMELSDAAAMAILEKRWQSMMPSSADQRTVLFTDVTPTGEDNGTYHFLVNATVHDYGAGFPANGHYGQTCIMVMESEPYSLSQARDGSWKVRGRMVVNEGSRCERNPAENASAIPLETIAGNTVDVELATAAPVPTAAPPQQRMVTGEWACWGPGTDLMFGLLLNDDGSYSELDGSGSGEYETSQDTIIFKGGSMGRLVGEGLTPDEFHLSTEVVCQPWRP